MKKSRAFSRKTALKKVDPVTLQKKQAELLDEVTSLSKEFQSNVTALANDYVEAICKLSVAAIEIGIDRVTFCKAIVSGGMNIETARRYLRIAYNDEGREAILSGDSVRDAEVKMKGASVERDNVRRNSTEKIALSADVKGLWSAFDSTVAGLARNGIEFPELSARLEKIYDETIQNSKK